MYNNNDKDNLSFLIRSSSPISSSPLASRSDPLGKGVWGEEEEDEEEEEEEGKGRWEISKNGFLVF